MMKEKAEKNNKKVNIIIRDSVFKGFSFLFRDSCLWRACSFVKSMKGYDGKGWRNDYIHRFRDGSAESRDR
jgi:hypothetical protein